MTDPYNGFCTEATLPHYYYNDVTKYVGTYRVDPVPVRSIMGHERTVLFDSAPVKLLGLKASMDNTNAVQTNVTRVAT
jgi:hypothetical protein